MSVTWNLVSERARRIPGRVFQDTQAMWARNEIHKCGGKRKHNLGSCCANATLSFYPTCWRRAQFRRKNSLLAQKERQNILKSTADRKCLSHMHFLGPRFAFLLSHYRGEKKS